MGLAKTVCILSAHILSLFFGLVEVDPLMQSPICNPSGILKVDSWSDLPMPRPQWVSDNPLKPLQQGGGSRQSRQACDNGEPPIWFDRNQPQPKRHSEP